MPSIDGWKQIVNDRMDAIRQRPIPKAIIAFRAFVSFSEPALVLADDGKMYVVKGAQIGRPLFTDHVVASLGLRIGAPVGQPAVVRVEADLISGGGAVAHFDPGPGHGTLMIESVGDREEFEHTGLFANRSRFAILAILYGWCGATDHQFLYGVPPADALVHSVDHGHFFGGMFWTVDTIKEMGDAVPDGHVVSNCELEMNEIDAARVKLGSVTDDQIADTVACPPEEWGVSLDERACVASWLAARRDQLASR